MRLKPEDARKLWCPMIRLNGSNARLVDFEREAPIPKSAACIADLCMMWRWFSSEHIHGYCGLAGEPDE